MKTIGKLTIGNDKKNKQMESKEYDTRRNQKVHRGNETL